MATAAQQATVAAAAAYWIDQSGAARARVAKNAADAVTSSWAAYAAWYEADAVAQQAGDTADLSAQAQAAVAGMFTEYVAQLTAALRMQSRVQVPSIQAPRIRNGADLVVVHARAATVFKETFAFTGDEVLALQRAVDRAAQLIETDIMLAGRQAQQDAMKSLQVQQYRRVLRPELSKSGSCALCVVASDRVYKIRDLLPIHDRCNCETMPIIDGVDLGRSLNEEDLKRLYAAAGDSTIGRDLKRVRVQVNEHGELGPVLSVRGQKFTGPDDLNAPTGPALAQERLAKLQTVLAQFVTRPNTAGQMNQPIAYQKARIEQLQRVAR